MQSCHYFVKGKSFQVIEALEAFEEALETFEEALETLEVHIRGGIRDIFEKALEAFEEVLEAF